jgi:hypothetical protein
MTNQAAADRRDSAGAQLAAAFMRRKAWHERRAQNDHGPTTQKENPMAVNHTPLSRPPVDPDDMLGLQRLQDERDTEEWLAKQTHPKPVDGNMQLLTAELLNLDVALGNALLLLAAFGPDRASELGFDAVLAAEVRGLSVEERLRQLRRDLRGVAAPHAVADIAPDGRP